MKPSESTTDADLLLAEYEDSGKLLSVLYEIDDVMRRKNAIAIEIAKHKVAHAIQHLSYAELSEIAQWLRENNYEFNIISRTNLEHSLELNNGVQIIMAAYVLNRYGPFDAMLCIHWHAHYPFESRFLKKRFGPKPTDFNTY